MGAIRRAYDNDKMDRDPHYSFEKGKHLVMSDNFFKSCFESLCKMHSPEYGKASEKVYCIYLRNKFRENTGDTAMVVVMVIVTQRRATTVMVALSIIVSMLVVTLLLLTVTSRLVIVVMITVMVAWMK